MTNSISVTTEWGLTSRVQIPLIQHQGTAAKVIVVEGQTVETGQPLTSSDNLFEVPVHASIDGTVQSISDLQITVIADKGDENYQENCEGIQATHLNSGRAIITRSDHDDLSELFQDWTRSQFIKEIHQAGLVGLGGSCFPVAAKLAKLKTRPAALLLINAAECDPAICCDEALLNDNIDAIASGIVLMQLITQPAKTVIGIETNKANTGQTLLAKVLKKCHTQNTAKTELAIVPSSYPNGAESLLVSFCAGKTLSPNDIHKSDIIACLLYTSPSPRDGLLSRMPSSA